MGSSPSQLPGAAGWWGGQGFGGIGSPGVVPQGGPQPAAAAPPVGPGTGNMAAWWGGQGVGGLGQQLGTTPGASFTNPAQGQDLWSRLMNAVGSTGLPKMPGTTVGAPTGSQMAATPMPPMLPQGQMRPPTGIPYFQQQQSSPQAGANNLGLMQQYMALQQLMRGA